VVSHEGARDGEESEAGAGEMGTVASERGRVRERLRKEIEREKNGSNSANNSNLDAQSCIERTAGHAYVYQTHGRAKRTTDCAFLQGTFCLERTTVQKTHG